MAISNWRLVVRRPVRDPCDSVVLRDLHAMTVRRFVRDVRGGATALAAAAVTLMAIGGIARVSDHIWLVDQRDALKSASDAAGIAATLEMSRLLDTQPGISDDDLETRLKQVARRHVELNLGHLPPERLARARRFEPAGGASDAGANRPDHMQTRRHRSTIRSLESPALVNDNHMQHLYSGLAQMANQLVQARVDKEIKDEAAVVLAAMGLTVSDAVRLLLTRVAREKELPFAPLVPNAETIAAMKEARAGNLRRFDDLQSLLDDLHAED